MKRIAVLALGLLVFALALRAALTASTGYDYFGDASVAIDSLARGDVRAFSTGQPAMGTLSLLLRAPFVALVYHADLTTVYLAGAIPCLAAALPLGLALSRRLAASGASQTAQAVTATLVIFNPVTFRALHWGHPEEILTGVLCVGAALVALRGKPLAAGLLLGLALASKQWALLAVLPVLIAAPNRRAAVLAIAGAVAAALTLPLLALAHPEAGGAAASASSATRATVGGVWTTPWNIWWPIAHLVHVPLPMGDRYALPGALGNVPHPLIAVSVLPLSLALWRRRERRADDALLLLALVFLVRCVFDNANNDYYEVPFILALLAWEATRFQRLPVLTLGATALTGLTFFPVTDQLYRDSTPHALLYNAMFLAWALPLLVALAATLFRPGWTARLPFAAPPASRASLAPAG